MSTATTESPFKLTRKNADWQNIAIFGFFHLLGLYGLWLIISGSFDGRTLALAIIWYYAIMFGISMGYHRGISHRGWKPHRYVMFVLLLFGAAAFQRSAMWWAAIHMLHHAYAGTKRDPHSILGGFMFAHVLWTCIKGGAKYEDGYDRLHSEIKKDPLILWQQRYYYRIAFTMFLIPVFIAGLGWEDWHGGWFIAGFARLIVQWHNTWFINSWAHWREEKAGDGINSLVLAILTNGEGWHKDHHGFPRSPANGMKWYMWDPSKWMIYLLYKLGLASELQPVRVAD